MNIMLTIGDFGMSSVYGIDKENFESYIDQTGQTIISDETWEKVANEIGGRVDNFMDELLELLSKDYLEGEFDD